MAQCPECDHGLKENRVCRRCAGQGHYVPTREDIRRECLALHRARGVEGELWVRRLEGREDDECE